jgi:hypothetical protein
VESFPSFFFASSHIFFAQLSQNYVWKDKS